MSQATYFWKDGKVIVIPERLIVINFTFSRPLHKFINAFCLDDFHHESSTRYGKFVGDESVAWEFVPFEKFPAEFRTNLLLLGLS
jgi:hypothetical protein